MTTPKLYSDLAELWPTISPPGDYAGEAKVLRDVLRSHFGSDRNRPTLLELGVGGGHTLSHLTRDFDAVAVDVSEPMLAVCRRLNPTVETFVGDMRTVRLGRTFDAVLIHDAIDYMLTPDDMHAVFATARAHLKPDGVFLVAPTYVRETFENYAAETDTFERDDLSITLVSLAIDRDERDAAFELALLFLLHESGRLRIVEDRHRCGLFGASEWRDMFAEAGFEAHINADEIGWTLFVARLKRGNGPTPA